MTPPVSSRGLPVSPTASPARAPVTSPPRAPLATSLWRRDESIPLVDHTVGGLLAERAAAHPDAPALVATAHGTGDTVRLTYAELYAEARRAATGIAALAGPGEHVALWAPNVAEWPILQYGAALAGVVLVALNPVLRPAELTYALDHSGATVLLHADRSRDYDMAAVVADVAPDRPALRHVVSLSERDRWSVTPTGQERPDAADPDAPVMLQYTSGTTGAPKGVLLRHRSLVNVARLTMEAADVESGCVGVNPLPTFHTASCVIGTLGPLWLAGCMVLVERFVPGPVLEVMVAERATTLFYVPTVLGALLEAARLGQGPTPTVRTVLGGGANVPAAMIAAAREQLGASVHNLYGQTELAPVLTLTRRRDTADDLEHTVGRPIAQVDCKIVDPATGEVQPLGMAGEICARGYQQLIGYHADPAATARTIDADGWVHTGDLGSMDSRGMITLTGRIKELIIRGGENIAPAEIESVLVAHTAVLEAAVVGRPDDNWGETVAAVLRLRVAPTPDLVAELEDHCRRVLSPHKVPRDWFVADELPVTPSGKVQKHRLSGLVAAGAYPRLT
jgi:fatty-acyl-CoA synthase